MKTTSVPTKVRAIDANGRKVPLQGAITLKVRLHNTLFKTGFLVINRLAIDVLIKAELLKRNKDAIRPRT